MSARNLAVIALLAVLLCGGAGFAASRIERDRALGAGHQQQRSELVLISLLEQYSAADAYLQTGAAAQLQAFSDGGARVASALARARGLDAGSAPLVTDLSTLADRAHSFQTAVATQIERRRSSGTAPTAAQSTSDAQAFSGVRAGYAVYSAQLTRVLHASVATADWLAAGLVGAVAILLAAVSVLLVRRAQLRERGRGARLSELRELLQVSASETEARQLLIRHLERRLPGAGAAVIDADESEDRLDVVISEDRGATALRDLAASAIPPADAAASATPPVDPASRPPSRDACLAVRLGRDHERGEAAGPLLRCDICGQLAAEVVCQPLLVGGRTLGAVLVASPHRLDGEQRAQLRESVTAAAPILAHQRNLELAESRAASDPLTGLPNRRSADEALKRMSAHAGRTLTPLAAVLIDVDRFKRVNDRYGHEHGDKVLSSMGQLLAAGVRASDFAARYGGEEFLMLLPDTDRRGAIEAAEKMRVAVEQTEVPVVGRLTASFGVAALPEDAVEPDHLLRQADRALYIAKARGRNRVEPAGVTILPDGGGGSPGFPSGDDDPV